MNSISSSQEGRHINMGWVGTTVEGSTPIAGNNIPGVVANGVEDVSDLISEAHPNCDEEDSALDYRIISLLFYATKDTKRHVLHMLEPAAEVALEGDVAGSATSAHVDPGNNDLVMQHNLCLPAENECNQIGAAVDHQPNLAHPAQTQKDPMHWARHDHDLSELHKATEFRRHTYSPNDSGHRESIQMRPQARTAPEPIHLRLPQTDHNTQFPHPKVSKGIAVPIPRNSNIGQLKLDVGLTNALPNSSNNRMFRRHPSILAATQYQNHSHHAGALLSNRLQCCIDGCSETFKGKAELKRHEDSKHLGKNYTCMFPTCPKYDQKFRPDKIKPHLRECHNLNVRKAPKSWYWPWRWYNDGRLQSWVCDLCGDFLGTWDLNRRQICTHVVSCRNGDEARESRWKGSGVVNYEDDEDIARAFRMSLTLEDPQGSASMSGSNRKKESSMVLSNFDDVLFGEYL